MTSSEHASANGVSRLVYGFARGVQRGPRRTAVDNAVARAIDRGMGLLGVAMPRVLVSGFWRSGTTWLQECLGVALGAKTVFEPLSPMEPRWRAILAMQFPDDAEDALQATIPGPTTEAGFWRYLGQTAAGRLPTAYMMSCRRDIAESFCRGIVVKDVRLQANLALAHARLGLPVAHVRRHPCAVVASLVAADWHWSFARVTLADLLPRLGSALRPGEAAALATRFDTDLTTRIAAFWAVTERIVAEALADQPWGAIVSYEAFASQPDQILDDLCARLGLRRIRRVDFSQPSASVSPEAFAAYGTAPPERWRRLLPGADIDRIHAVADAVFPDWTALHPIVAHGAA